MNKPMLHIYLNRQETLLLLEALVEQPFKYVFEIIGKLNKHLPLFDTSEQARCIVLQSTELSCCVKALGELPYNRVNALVNLIHQQLLTQHAQASDLATTMGPHDTEQYNE